MPSLFFRTRRESAAEKAWNGLKRHPEMEPWDEVPKEEFDVDTTEEFFEKVDERVREGVQPQSWCWCFDDANQHWYRYVVLTERRNEKLKIPLYDGECEKLKDFAHDDKVDVYRGARLDHKKSTNEERNQERNPLKIESHNNAFSIESRGDWVGSVGIPSKDQTPGILIRIEPKFSQPSVWDMIAERFQRAQSSKKTTREGTKKNDISEIQISLLGEQFVEVLKRIKSNGIGKLHSKTRRVCYDLRGRLDFARLSRHHGRGFPVVTNARSADILINRMFKCAVERLLRCMRRAKYEGDLKAIMRDLELLKCTLFQHVRSVNDFAEALQRDAHRQICLLSEIHTSDYEVAFDVAKRVLHHAHPSSRFGDMYQRPWVVNMSTLFEDFIRQLVKLEIEKSSSEPGYIVTREKKRTLFDLFNDFQIASNNKEVIFIGECKWKNKVSREDYFQVHTYITEFDATAGALIYPRPPKGMDTSLRQGKVDVTVISFCLGDNETFMQNKKSFVKELRSILKRAQLNRHHCPLSVH